MNRAKALAGGFVLSLAVVLPASAHHSITANFDASREVDIHGTVVDFNYVSPHASMVIDGIAYENGVALNDEPVRWEIESSAVKGLAPPPRPVVSEAPDAEGVRLVEARWTPPFQPAGETSALPLNEAGLAAWESYVQIDSPANSCEPMSIPVVMNAPSYYVDVRFGDGEVVLRNEAYDVHRTVPLGDSFAPADPNGQWV